MYGEFLTDFVFPLSPDYVTGWTAERAIGELIANAIDADPDGFSVQYTDGVLVIEDSSEHGVGQAGLVLGYSNKRDSENAIGQFGEGLKIAMLVLARTPSVSDVFVDTVRYCFEPHLVEHAGLIGLEDDGSAIEVMAWRIHRSQRTRGTRIELRCAKKVADKAMARFRHITEPDYTAPVRVPTVISNDGGSRVYIGGVLVSSNYNSLHYSYDLPLTVSKKWQNRDRSVIDSALLKTAVVAALCALEDGQDVTALLDDTLAGHLGETEVEWSSRKSQMSAETLKHIAKYAKRKWPDDRIFYTPWSGADTYHDSVLDLIDRGYEELRVPSMTQYQISILAELLGVKKPKAAKAANAAAKHSTLWVKNTDLTTTERSQLKQAVRWVSALYGHDALGRVRIYESTTQDGEHPYDVSWAGFYDPKTGTIALQRGVFEDSTTLLEVLVHETAHRIAHHGSAFADICARSTYADRTREFESTLHQMAARAVAAVGKAVSVEALEASQSSSPSPNTAAIKGLPLPAGMLYLHVGKQPLVVSETALLAAAVVREAVATWSKSAGLPAPSVRDAAKAFYVSPALLRNLCKGSAGRETPFRRVQEACGPLGVDAAAVWWAQCGSTAPFHYKWAGGSVHSGYGYRLCDPHKPRKFYARYRREAQEALEHVTPGPTKDALEALVESGVENILDDAWLAPIRQLVADALATH